MRHAARNDHEPARTEVVRLIADVEAHPAFDDVGDLLVRMAVRPRLVAGHQPVQRDRRGAPRKRLLLHALADFLPRNPAPIDLVNVHCFPRYLAAPSTPVGRTNRKSSRMESAATFLNAAPRNTTASDCPTPSRMPPTSAPSGRPKPPTIAAMNPLMANGTPTLNAVYCVGVTSTPARAPSAALSANDSASMRETGIPCSAAASALIEQARI